MRDKPKECPFCKEMTLKLDSATFPCRRWMEEDDVYTSNTHQYCNACHTALETIKSDSKIKVKRITNGVQVSYKTKYEVKNEK